MTRSRHIFALAGILLGCLALPAAAAAQATDPYPGFVQLEYVRPSVTHLKGVAAFRVVRATDPSGIASVWMRVDGAEVASVPQPCAADLSLPCDDILAPVALAVDTTRLGEGPHTFVVGTTDGDGYERIGMTRSFTVDNTVPGAAVPVTPLQLTTAAASVELRWQAPPGEPEAAVAKMTICTAVRCWNDPHPGGTVQLSMGVTRVSIVLRDAAGNSDPSKVTTWTFTRVRADPGLSITTAVARADGRTITVGGLLNIPHTNHVSVSVRARYGRRTRTVRTIAVTSGYGFRTELGLPSARWRIATVIARVAGNSRYLTVEKREQVRNPRRRGR